MTERKNTDSNVPQYQKFKDAARELGTDDRETAFDSLVKQIANAKPVKEDRKKKS